MKQRGWMMQTVNIKVTAHEFIDQLPDDVS